MDPVYVLAVFNLECAWEGLPPTYRIYVGDELFAERTWDYVGFDSIESLQIQAPPGEYVVRLEAVPPNLASFHWSAHSVAKGPAHWHTPRRSKNGFLKEAVIEIKSCEPENS